MSPHSHEHSTSGKNWSMRGFSSSIRATGTCTTADLSQLIQFILSMNVCSFNNKYHLQKQSTTMGTHIMISFGATVPTDPEQITLSVVEVDWPIAIRTHGNSSLWTFIRNLNLHHQSTIKFTATWSAEQDSFLDTQVYLEERQIQNNLHVKHIEKHQFLLMESCCYRFCKVTMPYTDKCVTFTRSVLQKKTSLRGPWTLKGNCNDFLIFLVLDIFWVL